MLRSFVLPHEQRGDRMKHLFSLLALMYAGSISAQYLRADELPGRGASAAHSAHGLPGPGERGGGPPANDDCANAQVILPTAHCMAAIDGDNTGATDDGPDASCDDPGATLLDVWYTFTTGAAGPVAITLIRSAAMTDGNYVLYEGSCTGNEVACRVGPALGQQELLQPATQYWLRVYSNPTYGTPGPFTICIQDLASVPAPPNDDCLNVTPTALAVGSTISFNGDPTYALNGEGLPFNSLWNAFTTTTSADITVDLCGTTASLGLIWLALYTTCPADAENRVFPGSSNYTSCSDGQATLCYGNVPPGTYYYAVSNALTPGAYTLNVSAGAVGSNSPANDDCAGAIPLAVGTSCAPVNFSPSCASASAPSGGCLDGLANGEDDTWYSFTATAAQMAIGMFPHSVQFGPILEIYGGTCGALNSIGCANGFAGDTLEVALDALVPGTTYFVKAYDGYFSTAAGDPSYDLCVVEGSGIGIGMGERSDPTLFTVHPNPTNGRFTLRSATGEAGTITVLDMTGRIVHRQWHSGGEIHVPITVDLHPGTYVVRMDAGRAPWQTRVVVQ